MKKSFIQFMCFASLSLPGCAEPVEDDPGSTTRNQTLKVVKKGGDWGCDTCGFTNGPIWGVEAVDTAAYGTGSISWPTYSALIDPSGQSWDVDFDHGELVAVSGSQELREYALEGWTLRAKFPSGDEQDAVIYKFDWVLDWTEQGNAVPTYGLAYVDPATGDIGGNVCPGMQLDNTSVVFLEGERYDFTDGSVHPENNIVTTACRGHALAKMALLGYAPYGGTSEDARQATLRMIRADYCGDGESYTDVNIPIAWTDVNEHVLWDPSEVGDTVEAHWDANGALCLGAPRLPHTIPDYPAELPCGLSPCDEVFDGNVQGVWTTLRQ